MLETYNEVSRAVNKIGRPEVSDEYAGIGRVIVQLSALEAFLDESKKNCSRLMTEMYSGELSCTKLDSLKDLQSAVTSFAAESLETLATLHSFKVAILLGGDASAKDKQQSKRS